MRRPRWQDVVFARLAKVGRVLALVVWLGYGVLGTGIAVLRMQIDLEAGTLAALDVVFVTVAVTTLVISFACWLIALRLIGDDPTLTERARTSWLLLLVLANLLAAPVYLTALHRRRRGARGPETPGSPAPVGNSRT